MSEDKIDVMLAGARAAVVGAPAPGDEVYLDYPRALAHTLERDWGLIEAANAHDLEQAVTRGLPETVVERLRMGPRQRRHVLDLCRDVARALPAVCVPREAGTHHGLRLSAVPKPLGVMLMVYEARPTVTVEGALLGAATGNAVLLRGGTEMAATDAVLARTIRTALRKVGLPEDLVTVLRDPDRRLFRALLGRSDAVDVLVPRGSPSLIEYCRGASTIPLLASGGGTNHLYVDSSADLDLAVRVILDSKTAEPTACNTLELVLAHEAIAEELLSRTVAAATADDHVIGLRTNLPGAGSATVTISPLDERDHGREFLEAAVGLLAVDGLEAATAHVRTHGSQHTEGVVATDPAVCDRFVREVDAAAVVVNGSLRLHDGPTLGLGPELSISTGRLHVRGPLGLGDLMTRTWRVDADGATRASLRTPDPLEGADSLAS